MLGISNGIGVYDSNVGGTVGGGIANYGTLAVSNSVLSNNAAFVGGGIYNISTATITNSTLSNNSAPYGGGGAGIANYGDYGTMTISNSTLSNNFVTNGVGGGVLNESGGTMTISSSTLSGNAAVDGGDGGGITNFGLAFISGSIVAENTGIAYNQCLGGVTDNGYNLSSDSSCGFTGTGSLQNTNPQLSPLANNGGPIQTMALQQSSPAIDAIPLSTNICPATDERGYSRPEDPSETACDMGAYESDWPDSDLALVNMPTNIITNATSPSGAVVTYTPPTTTDERGDSSTPSVSCNPGSGSTFAIGKTTVTCTATDSDDSNSPVSKSFTVTVKPVLTLKMSSTMKTVEGAVFNLVNVTGTAYGTVNPLTATITWGDGSNAEVISVTPAADGSYSVSASHSYAEEGSYSLTITVGDHSKLSATRTATVKVTDAALKITKSSRTISSLTATWTGTYTDADPNGTLSDYSASINWGDGNITPATVSANSSGPGFTAQGSHTYAGHATYTAILTITDSGGSTVSKTITITV